MWHFQASSGNRQSDASDGKYHERISAVLSSVEKVMELYYSEPKIRDEENAVSHPERFEGKIEFDNVSFQYEDGDLPVLHNISFTAHPNETVAIMGETGCGKTSLINLIPRFYEPTEGQIRN